MLVIEIFIGELFTIDGSSWGTIIHDKIAALDQLSGNYTVEPATLIMHLNPIFVLLISQAKLPEIMRCLRTIRKHLNHNPPYILPSNPNIQELRRWKQPLIKSFSIIRLKFLILWNHFSLNFIKFKFYWLKIKIMNLLIICINFIKFKFVLWKYWKLTI